MKQTLLSVLFVVLVECISAVAAYLKELLHRHMNRHYGFGCDAEAEFA